MLRAICDRCNGEIPLFGGYLSGSSGMSIGTQLFYTPDLVCKECAPTDEPKRRAARVDAVIWWLSKGLWTRGLA